MAWVNYNPTSTIAYTAYAPTSVSTWTQLEPWIGFGVSPFGALSTDEFVIHSRGFGDPTTVWTAV